MFSSSRLFDSPLLDRQLFRSPFDSDPFFTSSVAGPSSSGAHASTDTSTGVGAKARPASARVQRGAKEQPAVKEREEEKYPDPPRSSPSPAIIPSTTSTRHSRNDSTASAGITPASTPRRSEREQLQRVEERRSGDERDQFLAPFDSGMGAMGMFGDFPRSFGFGFGSPLPLMRRMEALMDRMDRMDLSRADEAGPSTSDPSSSFYSSSSSSSYSSLSDPSTGAGGSGTPFVVESRREFRRVGDVGEEKCAWRDSLGNERRVHQRELGKQRQQLVEERNAKGEERRQQNIHEIEPEKVEQFEKEWQQASSKLHAPDPLSLQRSSPPLLQQTEKQQPALTAGQEKGKDKSASKA